VDPRSPFRVEAAANHAVVEFAEKSGHTAISPADLAFHLTRLLGFKFTCQQQIPGDKVVLEDGLLSRASTLAAERVVASRLATMLARGRPGFEPYFSDPGLADDQRAALRLARQFRVWILCGGPGTGKTTAIRAMVSANSPDDIALCTTTGKAAKRVRELTGQKACTVHRLLGVTHEPDKGVYGFSPGFKFIYHGGNRLPYRMVVVDESSMADIRLAADLLNAMSDDASLVLVGDTFQLPSVGAGAFLRDAIAGGVPHVELTQLKRQDPHLVIHRNCKMIRFERRIDLENRPNADFLFVPCQDATRIRDLVVHYMVDKLPREYGFDPMRDIVALTPLKKPGPELSTRSLNQVLRARLNHGQSGRFMPGDRVIQLHNDYRRDVMNGETGTVQPSRIDKDGHLATVVRFEAPDRDVEIVPEDIDLEYAWALTVHKGQGSEWQCVIVPMHEQLCRSDWPSAQLLYTAISRARKLCVVIGQPQRVSALAAFHRDDKRITRLAGMLKT